MSYEFFEGYGRHGSVYGHDIIILEHPEKDKRKRRMCRCGCGKKASHVQYSNGVAMNSGCKNKLDKFVNEINKQKMEQQEKSTKLLMVFGLDKLMEGE